jgi:Uma2 family endonuclease
MLASAKTLTYEEFMQLPDKAGKQELVEGDLIEVPPPTERHSRIAHRLFRLLDRHLQAGMEARMETGYRMGERTCLQPDLSILRSDQPAGKYREGAPVLAVEIISEANRAPDVQRKLALYFEHGAQEVWLIYAGVKHSSAFTSELLPGLTIDPAALLVDL